MKSFVIIATLSLVFLSCKGEGDKGDAFAKAYEDKNIAQSTYANYGAVITDDQAMTAGEIVEQYQGLKEGDTAAVKFAAPINAVCAAKGCWMRLGAGDEEVFVKFKDYAFFVPTDTEGEAVVQGKAYLEEVSVEELRHMAEDAGKTKDEIAEITAPKRELRFMADGVLIKTE